MAGPGPAKASWRAPSMTDLARRRNGAEQTLDEGGPPDAIEPDEADDLSTGDVEGHGRGEPGDAQAANLEARRAGWVEAGRKTWATSRPTIMRTRSSRSISAIEPEPETRPSLSTV